MDKKARTFSPWSHLVSLIYAQLTHAIGLNDICDGLRLHNGLLVTLRGATPPSRNNLSHANKERNASMAEKLFWAVLGHLQSLQPGFARGNRGKGVARRFRRDIQLVDSTTIQLVVSCMDWAKHRRRKAAAKCHLRLDLHSFLPASPLSTPLGTTTPNAPVNSAQVFAPERSSSSTRRMWTSPISSICSNAASSG